MEIPQKVFFFLAFGCFIVCHILASFASCWYVLLDRDVPVVTNQKTKVSRACATNLIEWVNQSEGPSVSVSFFPFFFFWKIAPFDLWRSQDLILLEARRALSWYPFVLLIHPTHLDPYPPVLHALCRWDFLCNSLSPQLLPSLMSRFFKAKKNKLLKTRVCSLTNSLSA